MTNDYYPFQLGRFKCVALRDGGRTMPIEQVFPTTPREALLKTMQTLELETEVAVGMNLLYIDTGSRQVLVDTGLGHGQLAGSMEAAGINAADIDTVIITHGDGDHIGGLANFTKARFYLPHRSWELWTDEASQALMVDEWLQALGAGLPEEARAERAAGRVRYGSETLPALRDRIDLIEPEVEFLPGFKLIAAPGHRSDHFAVEIQSGGETLLHVADAFRHPVQGIHPEWATVFDTYAEQTAATAGNLFQIASEQNALVFCAHLAFPGLTRIQSGEQGWTWLPA